MNGWAYVLQGFIFGIAYVAPIGAQNLFVINISTNNDIKYILKSVFVVIFFDISLALACFIGAGIIFDIIPVLKNILLCVGCFVITFMGIRLIINKKEIEYEKQNEQLSLLKIIGLSFSVAWLNPQAIIDGTMLFGGMRSSLPVNSANMFMAGVCTASMSWFSVLAIITHKILDKFKKIIRYINILCGIILIIYGIRLGFIFIKNILGYGQMEYNSATPPI
jgi:L-lysine exporter family protein LysE/ArgO